MPRAHQVSSGQRQGGSDPNTSNHAHGPGRAGLTTQTQNAGMGDVRTLVRGARRATRQSVSTDPLTKNGGPTKVLRNAGRAGKRKIKDSTTI